MYRISLVKRCGYYKSRDRYDAASIRGRRLLEGGVYLFRRVVKMADSVYEYTIDCVIRRYRVYKATWVPSIGDILQCEQERGNVEDRQSSGFFLLLYLPLTYPLFIYPKLSASFSVGSLRTIFYLKATSLSRRPRFSHTRNL